MSFNRVLIPLLLLLLTTAVERGLTLNRGYVTIPLFEMLARDLPQDERVTADDYVGLEDYYAKFKVLDDFLGNQPTLTLDLILNDKATTVITDGRTLFERRVYRTEDLVGYNCTRWCYNVSVPMILNITGWSEDRLDGKVSPVVRLRDIHNATVKAIEERFCCNMTEIAERLNIEDGVTKTAAYIDIWRMFVPHVINATVKCKADNLQVTSEELTELLRNDLNTIRSYDLQQMDMHFFPSYENLLYRKSLFETRSIITGLLFNNWQSGTMAQFARVVSQFTPRDLEILYRWRAPQLFAIENIPMSIFQSGCSAVALFDPLFMLAETLFGFRNNLPDCDVAFLLSRSFDEVNSKFTVSSLSTQNVLEIFRTETRKPRWFDIYELLQLNIDEGIWVETPTLLQIATSLPRLISDFTSESSIPQAISFIRNFNTTSILTNIMTTNYQTFLMRLLNTYGYSLSNLSRSARISEAQLYSLTIQQAHHLVINSIAQRYGVHNLPSALGVNGVNTHVLINLPSFEWEEIVKVAVRSAFGVAADAFSVMLSSGGVTISYVDEGFPAIRVSSSVMYHGDKVAPAELASCFNRSESEIYALLFVSYHQLHINSIAPLMQRKIAFETQSMQSLLTSLGLDFSDVKSNSVVDVVARLTGITVDHLNCLYNWSSSFINTNLSLSFQTANETRLCNDFLNRTMYDIITIISQTPSKICFLCTTNPCGSNTNCRDVPDSFVCKCNAGFTGDPVRDCIDIPECLINRHDCHPNAKCEDTPPGSFQCTCKDGFSGDGRLCNDIPECTIDPNRCGPQGVCVNTLGSFYCDCVPGYRWNGTACVDIDECFENSDNCHNAATCNNTAGSFTCQCGSGLTGNGTLCEDIQECMFGPMSYPCHARADCQETFGSFICQCQAGYTGDGRLCEDVNECEINTDDCHVNATCRNQIPGFDCICNADFTGNGKVCTDIDECDHNLDDCHVNASCINTIGAFYCDCKDGFNGNGTYCYVAEVSFLRDTYSVIEGGQVEVTFSVLGAIDQIAFITVNVGGTATELQDYKVFDKAFPFQPGDAHTKNINISTIEDERLERSETIILSLNSLRGHVTPGNVPTTTITIIDDDDVSVRFNLQNYRANEQHDVVNLLVQVHSGIVDREIRLNVVTTAGTATVNEDFIPYTNQIIFSPQNAGPRNVTIQLVNNNVTEADEDFSVYLTTSDPDVNVVNSPATVTITDDDIASVSFESSSTLIGEDRVNVTVTVVLSGVIAIPLTARLNTRNALAEDGKDYTGLTNKDITFPPNGVNKISVPIQILEDTVFESNEMFVVSLSSLSLPHLIVVNPVNFTITIQDDDVIPVAFSPSSYSVVENISRVAVKVIVTGSFETPVHLSLSSSSGEAIGGQDFVAFAATLTFNPGDAPERDVFVTIINDTVVENEERFSIEMTLADPRIIFPNGRQATIDVIDNDVATVFIPNNSYTFTEGDAVSAISVVLSGTIGVPVRVRLSTVHNSATWPADFTAINYREIVFQPGQTTPQMFNLSIMDDGVVESTEVFYVNLTTVDSNVVIGTYGVTEISIIDNDQLRVRFSSLQYLADENSGFAQIGLVLLDGLETAAQVRLTPSNGTATEPEDFPLLSYDVIIDEGQPRIVVYRVNITNDMLEEYSEHFLLSLSALSPNVQIVDPRVANITIAESDDIFFCDPNARRYPCHIKADCLDVPGGYSCTCTAGYTGNGLSCNDINECTNITCPFNATCQNTEGSYRCICLPGFRGVGADGVDCFDINECRERSHNCHEQATCQNIIGSFTCECNSGWDGSGTTCNDIDECTRDLDNCHANATCQNTPGSFNCSCISGFRGDGRQCVDIDECAEQIDQCHNDAVCRNLIGSYNCTCKQGYYGSGVLCTDINECEVPSHNCHVNATCANRPGFFSCECLKPWFDGDGRNCSDVDECSANTDDCPANSVCRNTIGNFTCQCFPGFIHHSSSCIDIDECALGSDNCHADANCINVPGDFRCECKDGFTGNGTYCSNLDECSMNPGPCHENATCNDTHGSFNCTCMQGYTGNGRYCEDIIDCILLPRQYPCDIRAICIDVPGSFICNCPAGFTMNADRRNCDDVNECESMTFNCHANATCKNTAGSYDCVCKENFVGDGRTNCLDTTCSSGNPCSADADCSVNVTTNSYNCVCHPGFSGDGINCFDIDECINPGSCGANADCTNSPRASHTCTCRSGFTGDPYVRCDDVDECSNTSLCHANANCSNLEGSYNCICKNGFTGDGFNSCRDINECDESNTCDNRANCTNTIGGHYCTCRDGYTGDGQTCGDIDECNNPSNCPSNARCTNSPGTFACSCRTGFTSDGGNCIDINECIGDPCEDDGAVCRNTPGAFACSCPEQLYNNGNFCYVFCPFKLDVAFILDTSNSISDEDFSLMRRFVTETVGLMEIGENGNHIAAISFGNTVNMFMQFNSITGADLTRRNVINALSNLTRVTGVTRIDLALLQADRNVFTEANGMRSDEKVRKLAVLIIDGPQTTGPGVPSEPLSVIARRLQSRDITVLAIGVGPDVPRQQLLNITNSIEENVIQVNSFNSLQSVIKQFVNTSCTDIKECDLYKNCHMNADCRDTVGAYSCVCKPRYTGDGFNCADIDECATGTHGCHKNAVCENEIGSHKCTCKTGYFGNGTHCQDIDECSFGQNRCLPQTQCSNNEGSYTCLCPEGYTGNGRDSCDDIDECQTGQHNCHTSRANCSNNEGSFTCTCNSGFTGNGVTCQDIDECQTGQHNCHMSNAKCSNNEGSFSCSCNTGYTGNGVTCQDIDECSVGNDCHNLATCNNTEGLYTCQCNMGYSGDGRTCEDVNECISNQDDCHSFASCTNTQGSFECQCNAGYTGNGRACVVSDCSVSCIPEAICILSGLQHVCQCKPGYTGNGTTCLDINECEGVNMCHRNASCFNNNGSYSCQCRDGFSGDGYSCGDVNECSSNHQCHSNADCMNNVGSYTCKCKSGFSGDGFTCNDTRCSDECNSNADCVPDGGSFGCVCREGYTGNGKMCEDINECMGSHNCDSNARCNNSVGNYSCQCNAGFSGDGFTCTALQGCGICQTNAECVNQGGAESCQCLRGYQDTGNKICVDVNECTNNQSDCHSFASCSNTQGSFECQCNAGYTGNGTACVDIDECAPSRCGFDQNCRNFPGTYTCYCSSPGKFLFNRECIDASVVNLALEILNRVFAAPLAMQTSLEFREFAERLQTAVNNNLSSIYPASFLGSSVLSLSEGSVFAQILIFFRRGSAPAASSLQQVFLNGLARQNYNVTLSEYVIASASIKVQDYDECNPQLPEHVPDCPKHSYCVDTYASYSCECLMGYKKHASVNMCVSEDDDWWIIYAVAIGSAALVVMFLVLLFCCVECSRNKERYFVHDEGEGRPRQNKRIDEEVAPGFPGTVPRTSSTGSQSLLGSEKSEKIAMYEVNPIYDAANG